MYTALYRDIRYFLNHPRQLSVLCTAVLSASTTVLPHVRVRSQHNHNSYNKYTQSYTRYTRYNQNTNRLKKRRGTTVHPATLWVTGFTVKQSQAVGRCRYAGAGIAPLTTSPQKTHNVVSRERRSALGSWCCLGGLHQPLSQRIGVPQLGATRAAAVMVRAHLQSAANK